MNPLRRTPSSVSPLIDQRRLTYGNQESGTDWAPTGIILSGGLSRLADLSFTVIADGQREKRLREKGLVINGEPFRPWYKERKKRAL